MALPLRSGRGNTSLLPGTKTTDLSPSCRSTFIWPSLAILKEFMIKGWSIQLIPVIFMKTPGLNSSIVTGYSVTEALLSSYSLSIIIPRYRFILTDTESYWRYYSARWMRRRESPYSIRLHSAPVCHKP